MGERASELRWYLVFGAYRLAAIFAKLFSMMVAQGHMTAEASPERSSRAGATSS